MESKLPNFFLENTPWQNAENSIWLSTLLTLRRNIIGYPFSKKCTASQKAQLEDVLVPSLLQLPEFENGRKWLFSALSPLEKELLFEQKVYPSSPKDSEESTLVFGSNAHALLHHFDHLTLCLRSKSFHELGQSLQRVEEAFEKSLPFAFHPRFGYLTAKMHECGSGLKIKTFMHLPAMIHLKEELPSHLHLSNFTGSKEGFPGDVVVVSNHFTLGLTEEEILKELFTTCTHLKTKEEQLRENLNGAQESHIKDLVTRSIGLLKHSYELHIEETLEALSHVKLGLGMKWISGIEESVVNDLLFRCQKAHLSLTLSIGTNMSELTQKRAAYLHEKMHSVESRI
ncbi:MAG: hypothetical protein SNF33_03035 [Candidatus Algichlamydia australiensis]|nr:hypothetical protein [Chlamydiales bacterium]